MRGDFFQFLPTHKLVLLTNNRPRVKGTDHGVWRRLRLVPFRIRFWKGADRELDPDGDYPERFRADPGLGERLRTTEAEGILADMVTHAGAFYRAGRLLSPPAEVVGATAEYRSDQDVIGQFFAARIREDREGRVKASDLYRAFKGWWEGEGFAANKAPGPTKFGKEAKRKFAWSRPSGFVYHVRLLPEADPEEGPETRRVGGDFGISAHTGACTGDLSGNCLRPSGPSGNTSTSAPPDRLPDLARWVRDRLAGGPVPVQTLRTEAAREGFDPDRLGEVGDGVVDEFDAADGHVYWRLREVPVGNGACP
jgi:hypothetical protein